MTSFFGASSGRPRRSCSSVNMHVITSPWEGRTAFCYFVSGFADFTAQHNKTDGSSDFIGQKQCVKVNGRGKAARQGREITHGMMFKGGLQAEWGEELPESLVWGRWRQEGIRPQGMRRWNKEESPSESTFQSQTLTSCLTERMLSHPFKQLSSLQDWAQVHWWGSSRWVWVPRSAPRAGLSRKTRKDFSGLSSIISITLSS